MLTALAIMLQSHDASDAPCLKETGIARKYIEARGDTYPIDRYSISTKRTRGACVVEFILKPPLLGGVISVSVDRRGGKVLAFHQND